MSKKQGNLEACIREASQYLNTALFCDQQNRNVPCSFIYPLFVNAALSCELYLKAITMIETDDSSFYEGHDLNNLFNKISNSAQIWIKTNYSKKDTIISLNDLLTKYGKNFIDWRYSFENGSEGNSKGIIALAESLKEYVEKMIRHNNSHDKTAIL